MHNPFRSKDKKPVLLSFILQRDECSRLLGEFGEKHLDKCSKLILVWKNGTDDINIQGSASLTSDETAGLLMRGAHVVAGDYGH
jgi:hypothetical protein